MTEAYDGRQVVGMDLHRRRSVLVRMTPDLVYDQLIGAGCAAELTFSWGGNPGVGSLHRMRDAIERRSRELIRLRGIDPRHEGEGPHRPRPAGGRVGLGARAGGAAGGLPFRRLRVSFVQDRGILERRVLAAHRVRDALQYR